MKRGRPKGTGTKDNKSYGPLGDLVRKHRLAQGLGLADLAKACHCSVQFISNIEHGRAPLPWDKATLLAQALNIPIDEIQAANLTVRSDFKSFAGLSGHKVKKPAVLNTIASTVTLVSSDSSLQEIIQRYQNASPASRKSFVKAALDLLS